MSAEDREHAPARSGAPHVPRGKVGERRNPRGPAGGAGSAGGLNPLFRLLAINIGIGVLVGEAALAILYWTDTFGIASVIRNAADPWLPLGLLAFVFALTFAGAVTATAVLTMPYGSKDDAGEE